MKQYFTQIENSQNYIASINELLVEVMQYQKSDRTQYLNSLLLPYDQYSQLLLDTMKYLLTQIKTMQKKSEDSFNLKEKKSNHFLYFLTIIFSCIILYVWYWSNKQISKPINKLIQSAIEVERGHAFEVVNHGPKEVIELSNHLKKLTQSLSYQAQHDSLTQVYNRREFERRLNNLISKIKNGDSKKGSVLCYIDLDQFKIINDSCGHIAGDNVLIQTSKIIQNKVRSDDILGRLGGDEFALLLKECSFESATCICQDILYEINSRPYEWFGQLFKLSASIGITYLSGPNLKMNEALNAADTACMVAKQAGRNKIHIFGLNDIQLANKRNEMLRLNELKLALAENRFKLYKQDIVPFVLTKNQKIHFEVLIRMISPTGNILTPNFFLPLAEQYQMGTDIDEWVINNIIDWFEQNSDYIEFIGICSVNLSGQSLNRVDFKDFLIQKLKKCQLPCEKICFEITETAAIQDVKIAQNFIEELNQIGCKFALDDFGCGASSFSYLKNLPVDYIKIDGSFVKNILSNQVDLATVKSIVEVAKTIGKKTIAEYVENEAIANNIKSIGVDYAQGWCYSKPVPIDDLLKNTYQQNNIYSFERQP